jgi:indole-3-glycerol phosphate synthase
VLDKLFQAASLSAQARSETISEAELTQQISQLPAVVNVYESLKPGPSIKLIAEIKRRSPSKGFLADIPSAAKQASIYSENGAHAISVLTEESGFGGSLEDLKAARTTANIPLLRKDFISNEYQILEARANGADFILLILSWLKPSDFVRLNNFAHDLGLGVLVETHALDEIEIANEAGSRLIGINTRDLETFETDLGLFEKMAAKLSPGSIKVAESSVRDVSDVRRYRDAGADVVLVGEALVTGNPAVLIPEFVSVS